MATQMEIEFREMTGAAKKPTESRQQYLERVYAKVRDLSDDDWERLTSRAQQWFNDAGKAGKNQDLPDFPDVAPGPTKAKTDEGAEAESEDTMAAPKKKVVAKKAKAAGKSPAKKVANGNGSKGALRASGTAVLKRALLKNPKLDDKTLAKICRDAGYKLSPFSISARRADFLHTIKLLETDGRLKV